MKGLTQFILIIAAGFLFSCNTKNANKKITSTEASSIDEAPGSCPFLTKDDKQHVVLSWIKQTDSDSAIYCYAVSQDEGKTFGKAIEIPGSNNVHPHGENMPKVIFKPSGEIIAAWGAANPNPKNKYSGLVFYSQSFDEGRTWTSPINLTTDEKSFDQRYFDMALLPNGEVAITWLDNRKQWEKEGSGLYFAVTKDKLGFQGEKLISGPCCQCCRTDLFIDKKKNIHVLYRAIINDSIRDMVHIESTDQGNSFTKAERISKDNWVINGCPHTGPAMAETNKGLHFTWYTGGDLSGIYFNSSKDNGKTFCERNNVSGNAAQHCQITSLPNDKLLLVWNESFVKGSLINSRIGIEERSADGKSTRKDFVTTVGSHATFPVLLPVNGDKIVIAYTEEINQQDHVQFKQVMMK